MFDHTCTHCQQRRLIFPSQITGLANTDQGIVVSFTCWCDAPQAMLTGRRAAPAASTAGTPAAAPAGAVRAA